MRHQFQTGVSFGDEETLRGFVFSCRQCHLENYTGALYVTLNERRLIRTRFKDSISAVRKISTVFSRSREESRILWIARKSLQVSPGTSGRVFKVYARKRVKIRPWYATDQIYITDRFKRRNVNVSRDMTRRKSWAKPGDENRSCNDWKI